MLTRCIRCVCVFVSSSLRSAGLCPPGFTSVNAFSYSYIVGGITYQNECLQLNVRSLSERASERGTDLLFVSDAT